MEDGEVEAMANGEAVDCPAGDWAGDPREALLVEGRDFGVRVVGKDAECGGSGL